MLTLKLELKGVSPLLCHNDILSDPDADITKEIAKLSSKRTKTPEDRKEIGVLEFHGGLYYDDVIEGPVMPLKNIRRCLIEAAKINKKGKQLGRALICPTLCVPITYDGPRDIKKLCALPQHHYRAMVGISGKRIPRTRPCFPEWAIIAEVLLHETILDLSDLQLIVELAGITEGLGDGRIIGFGRFDGKVS